MYTKHFYESEHYQSFGYIRYLPKNFDKNKKYPLVFFLHGAGERGDDLDVLAKHGYMKYHTEDGREYPFIFISPQCPKGKYWGNYVESLHKFLDYICDTLPVDKVYLTGISMGGTGTYLMAQAEPSRFAAIAPICGSGIPWYTEVLKDLPCRVYHGARDTSVDPHDSLSMVASINRAGGKAELTIYPGVYHNCWDIVYSSNELIEWFLKH
ncbi:MAG: alpha/beta fold hydrolase [Clostridia bacterium]|nr:alpha/beta fold hydrolase [Clostridia bacterium]